MPGPHSANASVSGGGKLPSCVQCHSDPAWELPCPHVTGWPWAVVPQDAASPGRTEAPPPPPPSLLGTAHRRRGMVGQGLAGCSPQAGKAWGEGPPDDEPGEGLIPKQNAGGNLARKKNKK